MSLFYKIEPPRVCQARINLQSLQSFLLTEAQSQLAILGRRASIPAGVKFWQTLTHTWQEWDVGTWLDATWTQIPGRNRGPVSFISGLIYGGRRISGSHWREQPVCSLSQARAYSCTLSRGSSPFSTLACQLIWLTIRPAFIARREDANWTRFERVSGELVCAERASPAKPSLTNWAVRNWTKSLFVSSSSARNGRNEFVGRAYKLCQLKGKDFRGFAVFFLGWIVDSLRICSFFNEKYSSSSSK